MTRDGDPVTGRATLVGERGSRGDLTMGLEFDRAVELDHAGEFRLEMDPETFDLPRVRDMETYLGVRVGKDEVATGWAMPIPGPLALPLDLGTIVVGPGERLATGRVQDALGNPVQGAHVKTRGVGALWAGDQGRWKHRVGLTRFRIGQGPWLWTWTDRAWNGVRGEPWAETDEVGSFEVRAWSDLPELHLEVTAPHFAAARMEVDTGADGLVVTLIGTGELSGSARIEPHGWMAWDVEVRPAREHALPGNRGLEETTALIDEAESELWSGGRFRFTDLPHGWYDVAFRRDGAEADALVVSSVRVQAGEESLDPRLQDVDLAGRVELLQVEICDPHGRPILAAEVSLVADARRIRAPVLTEGGPCTLSFTGEPDALIVGAPGFATRRVPFEAGFMNVTLQPREPVALFLPPGIVAPQGASILVALAPQHGPAKDLDLLVPNKNYMRAAMISGLEGWGSFGMLVDRFEEGRASPWVTGGGAHRVLIGLSYPEGHDLHDFSRILEGGEVELPEEAPHQPLVIGLTQEALNAAEQRARELAAKLTR